MEQPQLEKEPSFESRTPQVTRGRWNGPLVRLNNNKQEQIDL